MARETSTELIELERDRDVDLKRFLACPRTAQPPTHFFAFDSEPKLVQLADQLGATAILTGEIGDDVFGHAQDPGLLAETLMSTGWTPRFMRAAMDYAVLTRCSIWRVISQTLSYRRWLQGKAYWSFYGFKGYIGFSDERSLASEPVLRDYERRLLPLFVHPWFQHIETLPPGKLMLMWSLVQATSPWFHPAFAGSAGDLFIFPLVSQPLVEAFWSIPNAFHFRDAENGAVARAAFSTRLSREVLDRGTGKGTPDLWIRSLIDRNRGFLKDCLLGGVLAKEGILDKGKLTQTLAGDVSTSRVGTSEVIRQLYAECWLRNWLAARRQAAA